ncbi:SOS response-associated peptidase [Cytobacillus firmus]|uniref:SOS response-associated peptidase n=1 Tax=Cytobacillus firmus TaxID=1399 RepID=UPI0021C6ACDB|nr:SOS response-associated peptidase [Cytobacillus firmus]MCU1808167.1 SOS response-associated peptidase [Cytobacillus firmus]
MCGRFSLEEDINKLQQYFNFEVAEEITPRFNIAPSQRILTIISDGQNRRAGTMKWGLVPFWAKEEKIGYKMINARSESIEEKPSFKHAFKRRRCLIVATGFYEWQKTEEGKQPYRFIMKDNRPFAFAGLWETWKKGEKPLHTCTIITTTPNAVTEDIHDRMPVILKEEDYDSWMDPHNQDTELLKTLLVPYAAEEMAKYKVSDLVNSPRNDVADVLSPLNSL